MPRADICPAEQGQRRDRPGGQAGGVEEDCGGVPHGRAIKCVVPGGVSSKVLTAADIANLKLTHEDLWDAGSTLGSGGMIVIAEGTCMVTLLQVLMRFYHHESCGQCTPCRHGTGWLHRILDRIVAGGGMPDDIERLYYVSKFTTARRSAGSAMQRATPAAASSTNSANEFEYYIEHKRSKFNGNLELPEIFINGQAIEARDDQTVMQVAREHGIYIPYFCWHPHLSVVGELPHVPGGGRRPRL